MKHPRLISMRNYNIEAKNVFIILVGDLNYY